MVHDSTKQFMTLSSLNSENYFLLYMCWMHFVLSALAFVRLFCWTIGNFLNWTHESHKHYNLQYISDLSKTIVPSCKMVRLKVQWIEMSSFFRMLVIWLMILLWCIFLSTCQAIHIDIVRKSSLKFNGLKVSMHARIYFFFNF